MAARFALADVASLVGEPARAAILLALLDDRALPANLLAREARLSAPATSLHLKKLTQGGLLAVRKDGRHRYYSLANGDVAHALEALGAIATKAAARAPSPDRYALRTARTCYDHLAGMLAVAFEEMLVRKRLLCVARGRTYEVTTEGARWFADVLSIDVGLLRQQRRLFARRCLDWTERRPHVAGALGAAVLDRMVTNRWVARTSGSRALRITVSGEQGLDRIGLRTGLKGPFVSG